MKLSVAAGSWVVVCALALLLLAAAATVKGGTDATLAAALELNAPYQEITRLERLRMSLDEVEEAIESYIENPSATHGEQFEAMAAVTVERLGALSASTRSGAFPALQASTREALATLARAKAQHKAGRPPEIDVKAPVYAAYAQVDNAVEYEEAVVRELKASLAGAVTRLHWNLVGAGLVALLLQASLVLLVLRDQQRRQQLHAALSTQNAALEGTIVERTTSLARARDELAWVSRRALQLQERERRLLALELHDQVGQQLAAMAMLLQHVESALDATADAGTLAHLRDAREVAKTTYAQIHDIAVSLRPAMLDRLGLVPAFEWYARQQSQRANCRIDVEGSAPPRPLATDLLIAAFRIGQEAVTNALRHGRPGQIDIDVGHVGGTLHLTVRDDGAGFDARAALVGDPAERSFGLLGMRERAEAVGGTLTIESRPGSGTTVIATLPLIFASASAAEAPADPDARSPEHDAAASPAP